jgi:16S rRNA (cytosine1402-N4)-methyltransferase
MTDSVHKTVLLNEAIEGLNLTVKSVVVDGTFGGGGHSLQICKKY